jgi:hypothetical protein
MIAPHIFLLHCFCIWVPSAWDVLPWDHLCKYLLTLLSPSPVYLSKFFFFCIIRATRGGPSLWIMSKLQNQVLDEILQESRSNLAWSSSWTRYIKQLCPLEFIARSGKALQQLRKQCSWKISLPVAYCNNLLLLIFSVVELYND